MSAVAFLTFSCVQLIAAGVSVQFAAVNHVHPKLSQEYYGGRGRIVGTVKRADTPANVSLRRRVLLLRERDAKVIAMQWSDAATGGYVFEYVDRAQRYTVLAFDHEHHYRAVIADNLTPEAM